MKPTILKKRVLAALVIFCMMASLLPLTSMTAQAADTKMGVKGFATVSELLAGHDNEGITDNDNDKYNIAISYGSATEGSSSFVGPIWKVFGDDGTERNAITVMGSNAYAAGGGMTTFNTEKQVASLSTASYEEYGMKLISRSTDHPSVNETIYSFQRKPSAAVWGTSAVRQRMNDLYKSLFTKEERAEILSNTIYTDVVSPLEEWDSSNSSTWYKYHEVYSTTEHLYLPYLDYNTDMMYVGVNSETDVTSGTAISAQEWNTSAAPEISWTPYVMMMRGMYPGINWVNEWQGLLGGHKLVGPQDAESTSVIYHQVGDNSWSHSQPDKSYFNYNEQAYALPCFSLDTSNINFASVFYPATEESMHDDGRMTDMSVLENYYLRFKGDLGTATISPDKKSVTIGDLKPFSDFDVASGSEVTHPVYLVVQYSFPWRSTPLAYAVEVEEGDVINAADLTAGALSDHIDSFDGCEVWLESTSPSRNITYATMAEQDTRLVLTQSSDTLTALQHQSESLEPVTFTLTNYQDEPQKITWFEPIFEGAAAQYKVSLTADEMIGTVLEKGESKTFTVEFANTSTVVDEKVTINISSKPENYPDATPTSVSATLHCKVISVGVASILSVSQEKYDALTKEDVTYEIFVPETQSIAEVRATIGDGKQALIEKELEKGTDYTISAATGDITFTLKGDWIAKTDWINESRTDDGGYVTLFFYEEGKENALLHHSLDIREVYQVVVGAPQNKGGAVYVNDQESMQSFYVSEDIPFTVKAVPDAGYAFDYFNLGNLNQKSKSNPLTLTLNRKNMIFADNTAVEAYFTACGQEATPEAVFTATGDGTGKLSNVKPGMKCSIDGGNTWMDITYGSKELAGVTAAKDILVYMPGNGTSTTDSDKQSINVTQAEAPSGINSTDCTTADQNDGKITGVDSSMEYKHSSAIIWREITGNEVTGLVNGTYQVRVKANGTVLASPAATVTIGSHTCVGQGEWKHDDTEHWKLCSCNAKTDVATHSYDNDQDSTCNVCGYKRVITPPEETTYKVTLNANGGTINRGDIKEYTHGTVTTLPTDVTREGYTFAGWYDNKELTGNPMTEIPAEATGNKAYWAKWTTSAYSITVQNDGNGEANADKTTAAEGETVTLTATPISGYHFERWEVVSGDVTIDNNTFTMPAKEVTVKAIFAKDTYDIRVTNDGNGEANADKTTAAEGETVTLSATPNSGYHFERWEVVSGDVTIDNNTFTMPAESVAIKAIFARNSTVTPPIDPPTVSEETIDAIADAAPGETVTVDLSSGSTKLDKEVFEELAGQDITLDIDLGDGVSWTVNGMDISEDADFTDIDMGVTMNSDGIPVDVVNAIIGEHGSVQVELAHDGAFGFTMTLTAPVGEENAGLWANLYHFDEDAGKMTFETAAQIGSDGNVALAFSHASQYAIVIDDHNHGVVTLPFTDVSEGDWFYEPVCYVYENGLMTGTSANTFEPNTSLSRAMLVAVLHRLEGSPTASAGDFTDVADGDWYVQAVNWAASVGVVNGFDDGTFQPNTAITREQLAAILRNYAEYKGFDTSASGSLAHYTDADSVSDWAKESVEWVVGSGLIGGYEDNTLRPQGTTTRAEVASVLQRSLEK